MESYIHFHVIYCRYFFFMIFETTIRHFIYYFQVFLLALYILLIIVNMDNEKLEETLLIKKIVFDTCCVQVR